jgi:hypothetical protein
VIRNPKRRVLNDEHYAVVKFGSSDRVAIRVRDRANSRRGLGPLLGSPSNVWIIADLSAMRKNLVKPVVADRGPSKLFRRIDLPSLRHGARLSVGVHAETRGAVSWHEFTSWFPSRHANAWGARASCQGLRLPLFTTPRPDSTTYPCILCMKSGILH